MKILYCAIDQAVPAAHGGSAHVTAVAQGLAALGHRVRALVSPGDKAPPRGAVDWVAVPPPFGSRRLRLLRSGAVRRHAEELGAEVVIERYYNFGGEGILAASRMGALAVLEVNAPVIDVPGSLKQKLDRMALIEPLRRWREWQCDHANLIVTPSVKIVPSSVPHSRDPADRVGRRHRAVSTWSGRPGAVHASPRPHPGCLRWSVSSVARSHQPRRSHQAASGSRCRHNRCRVHRRRPGARSGAASGQSPGWRDFYRTVAARRRPCVPRGRRHRRGAVRSECTPDTGAGISLVAAEDLRVHGDRSRRGGATHRASVAYRSRRTRGAAL